MTDSTWPLCTHAADQALIASEHGAITAGDFVARAHALAAHLPVGAPVLNVSQSHFGFSLGLAAALLRGCVSLMPPNFAPETVRLLQRVAPQAQVDAPDRSGPAATGALAHVAPGDIVCLHDGGDHPADLPTLDLRPWLSTRPQPWTGPFTMPRIAGDQLAALVFTSGSTGEPSGHRKTWGKLVLNARSAQARLAWAPGSLVATVPPQHMYGFESSVLLALHGGHAMWHGKPMLPADIAHALAAAPAPRCLISTPWHLSLVLEALDTGLSLPPVADVLSATAPLSGELAQRIEDRLGAPVHEIYGSTETGQIATHRTVHSSDWQLLDGVRLSLEHQDGEDIAWVSDGHIEGRVPLADMVTQLDDGHFRLIGRRADMVNIAGKRHSIAALNAIVQRLPGVKDGAFFDPGNQPDAAGTDTQVQRLCAFVVAPGLDAKAVTQALRAHIDPVFLPRPLWLLDSLPRNATSKLPRSALQALHTRLTQRPG